MTLRGCATLCAPLGPWPKDKNLPFSPLFLLLFLRAVQLLNRWFPNICEILEVLLKKFPRVNNGRQARGEEYYSSLANLAAEHGDLCDAPETDDESESNDDN